MHQTGLVQVNGRRFSSTNSEFSVFRKRSYFVTSCVVCSYPKHAHYSSQSELSWWRQNVWEYNVLCWCFLLPQPKTSSLPSALSTSLLWTIAAAPSSSSSARTGSSSKFGPSASAIEVSDPSGPATTLLSSIPRTWAMIVLQGRLLSSPSASPPSISSSSGASRFFVISWLQESACVSSCQNSGSSTFRLCKCSRMSKLVKHSYERSRPPAQQSSNACQIW